MIRRAVLFWLASLLYMSGGPAAQDLISDADPVFIDTSVDGSEPVVQEGDEPSASSLLSAFNRADATAELLEAFQAVIEASLTMTSSLPPETCEGIITAYHLANEDECNEPFNKEYRRIDGACNNLKNPNWGKATWPLKRLVKAVYADGVSATRVHSRHPDATLPNAREVSVKIGTKAPFEGNDPTGSMLLAILGQYIDHDLTHAPQFDRECAKCPTDATFSCCPIEIPETDELYKGRSLCMDLPRTIGVPAHVCTGNSTETPQREHLNSITSFLDASGVYGSDEKHLKELRDNSTKTSRLAVHKLDSGLLPLLPEDEKHHECRGTQGGKFKCGFAGDERAAEQPTLTAIHTIFVRLHNNIVEKLELINSHWDQERLFQEAKKIATGIWQHVVYNEYLPALLGAPATHHYKLAIKPGREEVPEYDETVSPTITNVFAGAAFRLGHSQIPVELERRDNQHFPLASMPLQEAFFNASALHDNENNGLNGFVLGNIAQRVNKIDRHFSSAIHGNLFFEHDKGFGLDLVAINIKRAREHGLPSYVVYREQCSPTKKKIESWEDLNGVFQDDSIIDVLKELYGEDGVREIDPFIGFVLEKHMPGGRVGHTLGCLLGDQFMRLRIGDRFWYERGTPEGFTDRQLAVIKKMTLSRIICDTLDNGNRLTIQPYALHVPDCDLDKFKNDKPWADHSMENYFPEFGTLTLPNFSNHRVPCSDRFQIPRLNLNPWKEPEDDDSASEVVSQPVLYKDTVSLDDGWDLLQTV